MKLDFLHKISEARDKKSGKFGFWQGKDPGLVLAAPAPSSYQEPVPGYEMDEFLERSLAEDNAADAVRATASLTARAILDEYPDAECAYFLYADDLLLVDVRDNYGSHVADIRSDNPAWEWVSRLDSPSTSFDIDFRDEWHAQKSKAFDEFKDPGFRTWPDQPGAAGGFYAEALHVRGAAAWTPPRTDAQKLDDYAVRTDIPREDRGRAEYAGAAKAILEAHPTAHSMKMHGGIWDDARWHWDDAEIYDESGALLATYDMSFEPTDPLAKRLLDAFSSDDEWSFERNERSVAWNEFRGEQMPWQDWDPDDGHTWFGISPAADWLPQED